MFIRLVRAIGTKDRQVREWSFSRKGLGTQYRDVSENEVFRFVLTFRGSRAVEPRRVRFIPQGRFIKRPLARVLVRKKTLVQKKTLAMHMYT